MSSTLWRAVAKAFGTKGKSLCKLPLDQIAVTAGKRRELLKADGYLKLASPKPCMPCLRHRALASHSGQDEHKGKSGIPDLFLLAISHSTGLPNIARFVEVKKPEEAVSTFQMGEIAFLNQMGMHAWDALCLNAQARRLT